MKINFSSKLVSKITSGKKKLSWRIGKKFAKLKPGMKITLRSDNKKIRTATILWIKRTTFENLTKEDWEGHEKYKSKKEMYNTYSKYYKMKVKPDTKLFVIRFKLN